MKKFILSLALVAGMVSALNAQVDGKAIGLRFGSGAEISYQHPLGDANRLELDLGLSGWKIGLTGIYQWVMDLSSITDGLKWYAGPGAAVGLTYFPYSWYSSVYSNGLVVGIAGQIGAEYNFEIPLQVSVDYRPAIYVIKPGWVSWGSYDGFCLAARYRF